MQDKDNTKPTTSTDPAATASIAASQAAQGDFINNIISKIKSSDNILIALSRDPSVDELSAAIGLAIYLDGMQKHTTAIYSGRTPDALAFLQPSQTFETNTDSLQDFIISLSKDKADHLRYKLEGDFAKIYITPYKSKLSEEDLTFSHGDYNVDFVIALNVPTSGDLDIALKEHGRIMHDASIVNITANDPGKFGEIEWSNPAASSICEMITSLVFALQESDDKPLDHDVATALLTGIVASTDRFSNNRTNSDTMSIASKLMSLGADQQLITSNVNGNEIIHNDGKFSYDAQNNTPTIPKNQLSIDHEDPNVPIANPATQIAPDPNLAINPDPTSTINNTNNINPEDTIVQPIIPGQNAQPTDPGQMQIPNLPNMSATPPANNPTNDAANVPAPAQAAPAQTTIPDPGQMQIPNLPPADSTPVTPPTDPGQMQIPNLPPTPMDAPDNASRPIIDSAPTELTTPQVGQPIQPPIPVPEEPKNYAEMMEAALAEDLPNQVPPQPQPEITDPAQAGMINVPDMSQNPDPNMTQDIPQNPDPNLQPAQPITTPEQPIMEPVQNPNATPVLPPPPAPNTNDGMMPPVLPPVQVPPQT